MQSGNISLLSQNAYIDLKVQDQPTHNIKKEARINSTSDSMEVYNA